MKLSILLRTSDFRGDHAADVWIAHDVQPDENVTQLAERLLGSSHCDVIEIRSVVDREKGGES